MWTYNEEWLYTNQTSNEPSDSVDCRYYYHVAEGAKKDVIWVGGIGGGWDTQSKKLYPHMRQKLVNNGRISSIRVHYRYSTHSDESVIDIIAGIEFLEHAGIQPVGFVRHSLGGLSLLKLQAVANIIRTVVTLSTQKYGAVDTVSQLRQCCSILLIHGTDDDILWPSCSSCVYKSK